MTIAEVREKCKSFVGKVPRDILIISILILASSASFGLGYLAGIDAGQAGQGSDLSPLTVPEAEGKIVASKNGTKYYLPECANAISDANKIWFVSALAAQAAGYSPATNCKGL
ncbi:MAG: hypothetical protein WAW90_00160 [Minisyncoccia bacterium]